MFSLSKREIEVLQYMVKGYNNQEIGKALFISKHTAKSHVSAIIQKMKAHSRTEVAYLVGKYNLLLQFD